MATSDPGFDARALRQVLGAFVTGVTVITTLDEQGRPHGLTANSFSSVSLDPPLILWSQSLTAPSHPVFRVAERFVVNILADDQVEVSNRFARGSSDKFAGCPTVPGLGGVPLIEGCAAYLECRRMDSFPGGDHVVFLGQVDRIERTGRQPLVFGSGRYLVAQPHDLGEPTAVANIARLQAVRLATRALVDLSDELDETLGLGVWGNKGPTIVRWEESSEPVSDNLRTGLVLPVLTSGTGLAFAAWLPRETTAPFIDAEIAEGAPVGEGLPNAQLAEQLALIRANGIVRLVGTDAFSDLYGTSISAASVPVFDQSGAMVLALTAIGSAQRLDLDEASPLVRGLRQCAARLSQRLGGRSPAALASNDPQENA
ncbi:flavin reductase [Ramlibacter sp.]|uniref:flavin reductase n=1 Tax=Ramlibacter sp. TaxID=1917967 RepID=UPI0026276E3B|nr:flavin reductase [Ramlibacter sp.]MDB5955840.1 flavin reductase [Ramlibacter sp.]